jgi:hypothetical protein
MQVTSLGITSATGHICLPNRKGGKAMTNKKLAPYRSKADTVLGMTKRMKRLIKDGVMTSEDYGRMTAQEVKALLFPRATKDMINLVYSNIKHL